MTAVGNEYTLCDSFRASSTSRLCRSCDEVCMPLYGVGEGKENLLNAY